MKAEDYNINIDTSQFFDKESVQRWADKAIGINDLIREFEKFTSKEYQLTLHVAFGFIEWPNEDEVVAIQDRSLWHHDKQPVLMVAGSRVHKALVAEEQKHDIHFERIDEETMNKIYPKTFFRFTDEDGKHIDIAIRQLYDFPPMSEIKLSGDFDLLKDLNKFTWVEPMEQKGRVRNMTEIINRRKA